MKKVSTGVFREIFQMFGSKSQELGSLPPTQKRSLKRARKCNVERNVNNVSEGTPEEGPKGTLFFPSLTNPIISIMVKSTKLAREVPAVGSGETSIRVKRARSGGFGNRDASW